MYFSQSHDKFWESIPGGLRGKISWVGVVVLTKKAQLVRTSTNKVMFNAFGWFDKPINGDKIPSECFIGVSAGGNLAKMMTEFDKGTVLLVLGNMVRDDYWSDRNKKDVYKIEAQFIIPQMDFSGVFEQPAQPDPNIPEQTSKEFNCGL